MTTPFNPTTDLERTLAAAQEGTVGEKAFMSELMTAQVFVPVYEDTQVENSPPSDKVMPLTFEAKDGTKMVAIFTTPDRAKPVLADIEGYEGGFLTEFNWVIGKLESGVGVSLNPGHDVGVDMAPEMIDTLRGQQQETPAAD